MRSGVSYALTVIGALLLLVGGISLYLREEIVDEDAFVQRSTAVLEDDAVRHAVARELAAEVSNSGPPQLVSARPILEGVFEALIGTSAFEQVFEQTARQANKLMFTRERTIVVTLKDAVTVLRSALEGANPKLAKQIPKDLEPELAKLSDSEFAAKALHFADDVRLFGILFPLLALVAFAGGIVMAPDRRSGVTRTGLAIGIVGVFLVVALTAMKAYLVSHLEGDILTQDELRAAASAIWDGFFGDLRAWGMVVGIAGLVLAAASSSLLEPTDVTDRAARLHRRLTNEPDTTRGRVLRALAIVALGIFVVVSPTLALQIVAILIGAYMLFWGTSELLTIAQPPRGAAEEMRREAKRRIAIGAGIGVGADRRDLPRRLGRGRRRRARGRRDRPRVDRGVQRLGGALRPPPQRRHLRRDPQLDVGRRQPGVAGHKPAPRHRQAARGRNPRAADRPPLRGRERRHGPHRPREGGNEPQPGRQADRRRRARGG